MNLFTDMQALGFEIWLPCQSHLKHFLLFCVYCWAPQGLCFCCFSRPSLFLPQGHCAFALRLLPRCSSVWFFLFIVVSGHTSGPWRGKVPWPDHTIWNFPIASFWTYHPISFSLQHMFLWSYCFILVNYLPIFLLKKRRSCWVLFG